MAERYQQHRDLIRLSIISNSRPEEDDSVALLQLTYLRGLDNLHKKPNVFALLRAQLQLARAQV